MADHSNSPANSSSEQHQRLTQTRDALLHLHKTLMDSERITYEQVFGTISSRNEFLRLLIEDPWFAWLRSISEFIVLIDEALEAEQPVTPADVNSLINQVRSLLKPSEEGSGFSKQYFDALQRDPDVVLAHADIIKLIVV
jgi:hypothetical protein